MSEAKQAAPQADTETVQYAIMIARQNWNAWREVFEHAGKVSTNPLLTNPETFKKFVREYSVWRTISKGTRDAFRSRLRDSLEFAKAIADDSGKQLLGLQQTWQIEFGTRNKKEPGKSKAITSVLSKIDAFVRPERFVAWDGYAKRGLNITCGRPASRSFKDYVAYLTDIDRVCLGELGQAIRKETAQSPVYTVEQGPRFQRRVLDVYLMKLGGRNMKHETASGV
jgi:hypothetical protein